MSTVAPSTGADKFATGVLFLGAVGFALFGIQWLANPSGMATPLGITLTNGDATSDARAVYGGMELGLGLFLAYSGLARERRTQGLAAAALCLGGLGTARLFGILAAGSVSGGTYQLLATDLFGTALCATAFFVSRKSRA
ncbi:MAG: DUF4345 family protein [Polyangiaceae bacterium]